jgi:hypothetical protein
VDHLDDYRRIRQQLAAALAAFPHDYDEAALRLQAADNEIAALEAECEQEAADLAIYLDAREREALDAEEVLQ